MAYVEQVDSDLIMDTGVSTGGINGVGDIMQKCCTVGSLAQAEQIPVLEPAVLS